MAEKFKNPIVQVNNVRLSYPYLWTPRPLDSDDPPDKKMKFEATAILDKVRNAADIKRVQAAIMEARKNPVLKNRPPKSTCLRSGDDTPERAEAEGLGAGTMTVGARSRRKPAVVDRRLNLVTEESGMIYAGCRVNMRFEVYAMVHPKSGPLIAAELRSVQFVANDKAFGEGGPIDGAKEFSDMGDADGEGGSVDEPAAEEDNGV